MLDVAKPARTWPSPVPALSARPLCLLGLWLLALALFTRLGTLGDPNFWEDEQLFRYIGKAILDGAVPYVDVWDRKPPGLFLLFALFAAVSPASLSFQVAALVAVAGTGLALGLLARELSGNIRSSYAAGCLYITALVLFGGRGGEANVFVTLPVAWAAWLCFARSPEKWGWLAMMLCGLAITLKQTAAFDGVCFGLVLLFRTRKRPLRVRITLAVTWIALGALPFVACGLCYLALGHWDAFAWAMVEANLRKAYNPFDDIGMRIGALAVLLAPLAGLAALGWRASRPGLRLFLLGWTAFTLAGLFAVPNMIDHYVIPLLAPLSILAGAAVASSLPAFLLAVFWFVIATQSGEVWDFTRATRSKHLLDQATALIARASPSPRLFVFDGPMSLYSGQVEPPPSPLIFPLHLYYQPERDTSQFATLEQVRRNLAWRPDVVVDRIKPQGFPLNADAARLVNQYVRRCHSHQPMRLLNEQGTYWVRIHLDCARS